MRSVKSAFGVIGTVGPILYCGGLLYYFLDLSGSVQEAKADGLGLTLVGLAAVGLLFSIPLLMKLVRIFSRPRSPGSGGDADASTPDGNGGFDADAVIARYRAQRTAEAAIGARAAPPAPESGAPARRRSFGRKIS
jgi:hypothetical protein